MKGLQQTVPQGELIPEASLSSDEDDSDESAEANELFNGVG